MRRILVAQKLYAIGAALVVFGTGVSIAFIVLVQLNFAIAPRIPRDRVGRYADFCPGTASEVMPPNALSCGATPSDAPTAPRWRRK